MLSRTRQAICLPFHSPWLPKGGWQRRVGDAWGSSWSFIVTSGGEFKATGGAHECFTYGECPMAMIHGPWRFHMSVGPRVPDIRGTRKATKRRAGANSFLALWASRIDNRSLTAGSKTSSLQRWIHMATPLYLMMKHKLCGLILGTSSCGWAKGNDCDLWILWVQNSQSVSSWHLFSRCVE